ncbi:MAG TPA: purine-nucleoside phosphorylase [candidate division Zixibacteria bacterium]|nr:purine-nucleoside phosphorylase [candidate division Zixibacteria bacterium]
MEVRRGGLPDGLYGAELEARILGAADAIRERLASVPALAEPRLAFVLGSGLGGVVDLLDPEPRAVIPYREIPGVPGSEVEGHAGELVAGTAHGRAMVLLSGRAHPYEGWTHRESTLLLRAVLSLGVGTVVLTNAAGGVNPEFDPGDVMLIEDVINLSGSNPLTGPNLDRFGPRFVPMTDAMDAGLRATARVAAERAGVRLREGVYVMLAGPSYETRAELRMLRTLGADAVGMSTVHEVIVARHMGVRVLGFSLVTNKATPDMEGEVTHEEVLAMGPIGAARLVSILRELLPELG